ncbi:hypothetical protein J6TS2_21840 [Heyndrickxia sporothermodurans]|nr:hypothetical protein J6TS2_21840 [Heyndrickxia sporothermodurans]
MIDYVAFPDQVARFVKYIRKQIKSVEIKYVVLWVNREELLRRDALRTEDHQMGERCLELVEEFESKGVSEHHLYQTTNLQPSNIDEMIIYIKEQSRFLF